MDRSLHLGFTDWLILLWGLVVMYWMSRAPKSILTLFGLGTEVGHSWLVKSVKGFGSFAFFSLMLSMLLVGAPPQLARMPGYGFVTLVIAAAASVFLLRKPKKIA